MVSWFIMESFLAYDELIPEDVYLECHLFQAYDLTQNICILSRFIIESHITYVQLIFEDLNLEYHLLQAYALTQNIGKIIHGFQILYSLYHIS